MLYIETQYRNVRRTVAFGPQFLTVGSAEPFRTVSSASMPGVSVRRPAWGSCSAPRRCRAIAWGDVRNGSQNTTGSDRRLRRDMFSHQSTSPLSSRISGKRSSRVLTAMLASTLASGAPRQISFREKQSECVMLRRRGVFVY